MNLKIKSLGVALLYCFLFRLSFGLGNFIKESIPDNYYWFVLGIFGTVSILVITWIFLRVEKKSFRDIGLNWEAKTPTQFLKGIFIGIGIACTMLLLVISFTDLIIELSDDYELASFLFFSLAFIPTALMEEIAFRSYPFLKLNKVLGLRFSQVFLAILFALYHFGEGPLINLFIGPGVWAFVYGMAAVYSKGIAMPTGLHFGVNFILASIGDKEGLAPIFTVKYSTEANPEIVEHAEFIGVIGQFVLFSCAIVLMEYYLRKKKLLKF